MVNTTTDMEKFRDKGEAVEQREESSERCKQMQEVRPELWRAFSGGRAGVVGIAVDDPGSGEK